MEAGRELNLCSEKDRRQVGARRTAVEAEAHECHLLHDPQSVVELRDVAVSCSVGRLDNDACATRRNPETLMWATLAGIPSK